MGQFSWFTSDNKEQIPNDRAHTPIYMLDDKGNIWEEKDYAGYGEFGGKDFYELVAEMNDLPSDRDKGITLYYSGEPFKCPALVHDKRLRWDMLDYPQDDPDQGWTFEDEDETVWDYS